VRSPYGLDLIDSCLTCKLRQEYLFCNLPAPALKELEAIKSTASYPKGAQLFVEGQEPRGVFVLCHGRAKLAASSREGRTMILKIAEAGEVLGLSATVSGKPYEVTAELLEPSQANFIGRDNFLNFLGHHGEAAVRVAQQLSQNYHSAYEEIRSLGLSETTAEKFARLLLEWSSNHGEHGKNPTRLTVTLTHEEIAQLIGSSRETITRLFSDFKKKRILEVKGSSLIIRNKSALEKIVGA
jgi:CRP/FNR family transcriptional regulator, cyclic AMP receptor protein